MGKARRQGVQHPEAAPELPLWSVHDASHDGGLCNGPTNQAHVATASNKARQSPRPTHLRYATDTPPTGNDRALATLALHFLGVGTLEPGRLAESASWDRSAAQTTVGRDEILHQLQALTPPISLAVTQIVAQGKTTTVSGRLTRDGQPPALFCHVLRFTDPAQGQIAQVVSFEQEERT
ncbi:hypothetical protein C8N42_10160 [Celeribacter persicus]|uniref:SnoaL-like protein n=1 Tax=Celeribacter persicus TaxID=1651082 RepID=A0A2T5HVB5_9RHOB|nr:hypothetical protein C8N42_10160 [Celeribacter persicus]